MTYAHHMGIVHRDLKPDNVFITHKNEVKIMDFGVAKILDNKEPTRSRSMVGTLLYISPEQINGRDADVRSDIYTIGISLFEAVTGRLPFERRTDYGLMHAHILEEPPRPRQLKRDLPKELERVILTAIEKEPDKRYQSASEFHAALLQQSRRYGLKPADGGRRECRSAATAAWRTPGVTQPRAGRHRFRCLSGCRRHIAGTDPWSLSRLSNVPLDEVEPVTRLVKKKINVPLPAAPAARPSRETPKQDNTAPADRPL